MGINSIKSVQKCEQNIQNLSFTYQDMIRYRKYDKIDENYIFLNKIGQGSSGSVYRSKCLHTQNYRAIKKILKTNRPHMRQYLQNQFNISKQIDHPNIVKIYELYQQIDSFYIVYELCQGKQLYQLILEDKIIGEERAFIYFYEILITVNFLHKNYIMHRDIKPQNIIANQNTKSIKLIDLGTSIKFQNNQIKKRKRIGTSYYIAPQVLKRQYNQKCDIWSLGVILYILLTGLLPFKGKNDQEILKAVEIGKIDFINNKWRNVSSEAIELVKKMLQRDPYQRLSAEEILQSQWVRKNYIKLQRKDRHHQIKLNSFIQSHLTNMNKFKQLKSSSLQQGLFIFMVNFIDNKKNQKQLYSTFKALDQNHDGVLSLKQLQKGLQIYLKMKPSEFQIIAKKIFQKVDINNSGSINYTQFIMSASNIQIVVTQQNLDLAFKYLDSDNSGKLEVREIRQKLGTNIKQEQYLILLRQFDINSDGEISIQEFKQMMKSLVNKKKNNWQLCKNPIQFNNAVKNNIKSSINYSGKKANKLIRTNSYAKK